MFTQDDFRGRGQWQGQGRLHNLCNQGCDQGREINYRPWAVRSKRS